MQRAALFTGLAIGVVLAGAAAAHSPYLKPTTFAPEREFVTVEAAMTEVFFVPDFPIRTVGDYWAIGETGAPVKISTVTALKEYSAVEVALPAEGTYRVTTGLREGRATKWAKVDGVWKQVRAAGGRAGGGMDGNSVEEGKLPAGAETMMSQAYQRADTYVTRGKPTSGVLKPTGQGIEAQPLVHPNSLKAGQAFTFKLLNDGKPLPAAAFEVFRAGDDTYAAKPYSYSGKTDATGGGKINLTQPGAYIVEVHYPADPEGGSMKTPMAKTAVYSLTFDVKK